MMDAADDICDGALCTYTTRACKTSYDWGVSLSTELLQEIARHAGPQSLAILRCVCQSWRRSISRAVRTVRLIVPDRRTAPAEYAIAEPAAADAQARPPRKGAGTGRVTGRATVNHAQQQQHQQQEPQPDEARKAAEAAEVSPLAVRSSCHHTNAPAFPGVRLPGANQPSLDQIDQQVRQQQQQPTGTDRGFATSSGRPPLNAYAPDPNSYVGPRPCFEPRPAVDSLAYEFNQHRQSVVAAVAAAALTRKQGEASDSHAAGVASSVGSSSIVVWSFLEAADKLATAFPLYDNLNLNFAEPLPLATGSSGCGEVGNGRWLQLEMSAALQRLLSNRMMCLSLSGHTPYPLIMGPPPLPLQMSSQTAASAPGPEAPAPSASPFLRVASHLARPRKSPPPHFISHSHQQHHEQRPEQRPEQQEERLLQHRLKRSSKRSMSLGPSVEVPGTAYAEEEEEEEEALVMTTKAPPKTTAKEALGSALGGAKTRAKCEMGFGAGPLPSYIQRSSEDARDCQQQQLREQEPCTVGGLNKQESEVGRCCQCQCSNRRQMFLAGTASTLTTDVTMTVADALRALEEGSTAIPRALGLDPRQQLDTSYDHATSGNLPNRHYVRTDAAETVRVDKSAPSASATLAAKTPVLPPPSEAQPAAVWESGRAQGSASHRGSSGSATSEGSLSLSARRHYEASDRDTDGGGGFGSAEELGRLRSQACGAVKVDSQLGPPETTDGSGAAGEGLTPQRGASGIPSTPGGADGVSCMCIGEGDTVNGEGRGNGARCNVVGGEAMELTAEGATAGALLALAGGSAGNSDRGRANGAGEAEAGGSGGDLAGDVFGASAHMDFEDGGTHTAVRVRCVRAYKHYVQPMWPRVAAESAAVEAGMADGRGREEGASRGDGDSGRGGPNGAKAINTSVASGRGGCKQRSSSAGGYQYRCSDINGDNDMGGYPHGAEVSACTAHNAPRADFHEQQQHRVGGSSGHASQALDSCCGRREKDAVPTAAATAAGSGSSGGAGGSATRRRNLPCAGSPGSVPHLLDPYAGSIPFAISGDPYTTVTGLTAATAAARAAAIAAGAAAALDGVEPAAGGQRAGNSALEVVQMPAGAEDTGAAAARAPPLLSRLTHLVSLTLAADLGFPSPRQLEAITSLRNLQRLDMRGAKFMQVEEDASLVARQAWLHVGNEHVAVVARCTGLTSLSLNHLHSVSGVQLAALTALSKLTSLGLTDALSGNTVHSLHIRMLAKALTNLRSLEIGRVTCPPLHLPQQPQQLIPVSLLPLGLQAAAGPAAAPPPPLPPPPLPQQHRDVTATGCTPRYPPPSSTGSLHGQLWGPVLGLFQGLSSLHLQVACSFETELLSGVAALPLLNNFTMELLDVPPSQLAAMLEALVAPGPNLRTALVNADRGGDDSGSGPRHAATTLPRAPGRGSAAGGRSTTAASLGGFATTTTTTTTTTLPAASYDANPVPAAAAAATVSGSHGDLSRVFHGLTLTACMLYDEHLGLMGRLGSLRVLRLDQVDIRTRDPDGWTALSGAHALESFSFRVWNNPVLSASNLCVLTNDSLAMMAVNWPHLQQLNYCGKVTLTEKAEEHLACMPRLTSLEITGTDGTLLRVWRSISTGQLLRTIALPHHATAAAKVSSRNGYVTYSDSGDSANSEGSEASVNWMGEVGYVTSEYDAD